MASYPQLDLPFLPYGKAMGARRHLLQVGTAERGPEAEGAP